MDEYLYPLRLSYATASMLWGGRRLIDGWGKKTDAEKLAETWELTVRGDGRMSLIENGSCAGMPLGDYIKKYGNETVSEKYDGGRFPLLIKLIDAADRLSVQVHPDDAYAAAVEHDSGKTEMWYIVEAAPDAEIVYGLADGVGRDGFAAAVAAGEYDSVMKRVPVRAGESYFIPAGMLHAIGKGILIAEIQQNSDLTYRVYDYDRPGADGRPRELHVKKALDVVRPFTDNEAESLRFERGARRDGYIADSKYFNVRHVKPGEGYNFTAGPRSFEALLSVGGSALLTCRGGRYRIGRGECWFIPAGAGDCSLEGDAEILIAGI